MTKRGKSRDTCIVTEAYIQAVREGGREEERRREEVQGRSHQKKKEVMRLERTSEGGGGGGGGAKEAGKNSRTFHLKGWKKRGKRTILVEGKV